MERAQEGNDLNAANASAANAAAAGRKPRLARRHQRRLFYAEQVLAPQAPPKKKYLATQRLRRDVERAHLEALSLDVNFLKQEIANLETVRSILEANRLAAPVTTVGNLMAVVNEYFRMIQFGLGAETPASSITLARKLDFLRAVFDENVNFGLGTGVDAFIAQCQGYTIFHALFYYETPTLTQVRPAGEEHAIVIIARNRLRVRISRRTLEVMFPHLLRDEVMVQALIGSEMVYPCEITIYFDQHGRVVRHDAVVDFVAGLTQTLRNIREVTEVMDTARLKGSIIVYEDKANNSSSSSSNSKQPPAITASDDEDKPSSSQSLPPITTSDVENKWPRQPEDESSPVSPVRTPTTDGVRGSYAPSDPMSHASPTTKAPPTRKESVSKRMSIHSLLT